MGKELAISNVALDCSKSSQCDGMVVIVAQPAGSDVRFVFAVAGAPAIASIRTYPVSTNAVAGDIVNINGVAFPAVASGATGNQFNVGASTTATATNLAAVLNANTTINALFTATANANIVTLTEKTAGGGNNPTAATKTGTVVIDAGTYTPSTPVGGWYKLVGIGTMSLVPVTQAITASTALAEGNTVAELTAATSIPGFAGRLIRPAIGILTTTGTTMPTVKVGIKAQSSQAQLAATEFSPEYILAKEDIEIADISVKTTLKGAATILVEASLKQGGVWSEWMPAVSAKRKKASAIKYKSTSTVSVIGGADSAKVDSVTVVYKSNNAAVAGVAEIVTDTVVFGQNMKFGRCTVKHEPLKDAVIRAYITFSDEPQHMAKKLVGTGTGQKQTYPLGVTKIAHETIKVWHGTNPCYDYDFNTGSGDISCTAPDGVPVMAECDYGVQAESWAEMTKSDVLKHNDSNLISTGFTYSLPVGTAGKGTSTQKVVLEKVGGTVADALLGTASGKTQMYLLDHAARADTINIKAVIGNTPVPATWIYDPETQILTVVSQANAVMTMSYDWTAETPILYTLVASWSV